MPYRDPQVISHFEEMDRQSKAHHAAMNRKLGGGTYYPPSAETMNGIERWGRRLMLALVVVLIWFAAINWRVLLDLWSVS